MWAPGTYLPNRDEGDAVHANIGVEKYFFEAGDRILQRIKDVRGTAILPERTGPIADVLYSAAGNSADEHWYNRGVIAYSFEVGADRYVNTTLSVATAAGATGIRPANRTGFQPGDTITFDKGTATQETATVLSVAAAAGTSPAPNVTLTAPLAFAHAAGVELIGGLLTSGVGFQPPYASEGKFEALEFAAGNYGLLESALDYAFDEQPPKVIMTGPSNSRTEIETTFQFVNEPSQIRYTTDGSAPNASSTLWDSTGPREPGADVPRHADDDLQVAGDRHQGQRLDGLEEVHDPRDVEPRTHRDTTKRPATRRAASRSGSNRAGTKGRWLPLPTSRSTRSSPVSA